MQHNVNHNQHQPIQPIQAPPSLLTQVLGRIQQAEQIAEDSTLFSTAFTSPDWTWRVAAIEQLAHVEREMALPWLERALSDTHPSVRTRAVHMLGQYQASELIRPALHDPDWQVREVAMLALGMQDEPTPPEFLAPAQSNPDAAVSQPLRAVSRQQPLRSTLSGGKPDMRPIDQQSTHPFSSQSEADVLQEERQRSARMSTMQQRESISAQRKRLPRFLSLAAAVLVSAVLIGSAALVFSALKVTTPSTGPASHGSTPTVKASTATATPTVAPECRDVQDQVDETLCSQHKETRLNITKNFSGHEVTFVRAYADVSQLMLIYTTKDSPHSDVISFMSLTIQPEIRLAGGGLNVSYENPETHQWYYVISFGTQDVPAGTTALHIQSIVDAFSGTPTQLRFTIPFNTTQKNVSVKQTVTSKGTVLTLDHLVLTGSSALIYLKSPQSQVPGLFLYRLSINGQQVASTKDTTGSTDPLVIHLSLSLLDKPGAWMVQIMAGTSANPASGATWTFHFTVPDTTQTK
jgi:hypothetical protein